MDKEFLSSENSCVGTSKHNGKTNPLFNVA